MYQMNLLDRDHGLDLRSLSKAMGHSSLDTSEIYLRDADVEIPITQRVDIFDEVDA